MVGVMVGRYIRVLVVGLIAIGLCIVYQVDQKIQQRLQEKNIEYRDISRYWDHYIFQDVQANKIVFAHSITVSVAELEVYWFPSYVVYMRGVDIRIESKVSEPTATTQDTKTPQSLVFWDDIPISIQQMAVHSPYGNIENMHGTLSPNLMLENKELRIQSSNTLENIEIEGRVQYTGDDRGDNNASTTLSSSIENLEFSGDYHIHIQNFSTITGEVGAMTIKHDLLGIPVHMEHLPIKASLEDNIVEIEIVYRDSVFHAKSVGFSFLDRVDFSAEIQVADTIDVFQVDHDTDWKVSGFWDIAGRIQNTKLEELSIAIQQVGFVGDVSWVDKIRTATVAYQPIHAHSVRYIGMRQPQWVAYSQLGHFPQSVLAGEDILFFSHNGFNTEGMTEAIKDYVETGELRGGSSITQQVAKNLFMSTEKTIRRKVEESLYTIILESMMSKQEILEIYCNIVEFGKGLYGVQSATDAYFAKDPKNANWKEAVFLVSILPNPQYYYTQAKKGKPPTYKMRIILDNAVHAKFISRADRRQIEAMPLHLLLPVE